MVDSKTPSVNLLLGALDENFGWYASNKLLFAEPPPAPFWLQIATPAAPHHAASRISRTLSSKGAADKASGPTGTEKDRREISGLNGKLRACWARAWRRFPIV